MQGIIFDIQHYALYDGPGIRTCIYFKGCPLTCTWCHNPESQKQNFEIAYSVDKCCKCRKCITYCEKKALTLTKKGICRDLHLCIACGQCVEICKQNAIEIIGKEVSSGEIAAIAAQDILFYNESGGGVTISGGEPSLQAEFLLDTLKELKNRNIHTAIETCGYFNKKILPDLARVTDLFLFDIKHLNNEKHKECTGVHPDLIVDNFKEILYTWGSRKIIPRIPLIPGFNTDKTSIEEIISFFNSTGYSGTIHLMPYNNLSKIKYEKIGRGEDYCDRGIQNENDLRQIITQFKECHYSIICNH